MLATRMQSAAAGAGGLSEDLLSWIVPVDVFMTATSNINWAASSVQGGEVYNAYRDSSSAQNDEVSWVIALAAGTWTFNLIHYVNTVCGIFSVRLDGVEVGTIDSYGAALARNTRSRITGISVATTGSKTLLLKMATKNASASAYYGIIQHIVFQRTA